MSGTNLKTTDWEHRLNNLLAWRKWRHAANGNSDERATYGVVLDGCAVTVRALCDIIGVKCYFEGETISQGQNRTQELFNCCNKVGKGLVSKLPLENQRCLLEVLYLGNRAIAHPKEGGLYHEVGKDEITVAINIVLHWLANKKSEWPELAKVPKEFLEPIAPSLPAP